MRRTDTATGWRVGPTGSAGRWLVGAGAAAEPTDRAIDQVNPFDDPLQHRKSAERRDQLR